MLFSAAPSWAAGKLPKSKDVKVRDLSIDDPGAYPIMQRCDMNPALRLSITAEGSEKNAGEGISELAFMIRPAAAIESVSLRSSVKSSADLPQGESYRHSAALPQGHCTI